MNIRLFLLLPAAALLILSACKKDSPDPAPAPPSGGGGTMPVLTTQNVTSITGTTATAGGTVSAEGGSAVTARGVAWGTAQNPTTANSTTSDGSGEGDFASIITGLTPNTVYYVRAYATNSTGTAYGNQVSFTTTDAGGGGIVTNPGAGVSFNGHTYSSIVLGNGQEWMAENLRTTVYANGDPITNVTASWENLTTEAWAHWGNASQYENPYGKLYNWYAVSDPRNVCPSGWHVPTDAEWTVLTEYLGGELVAGGKMKSTGTQYWESPNIDATNESGFAGLPGGARILGPISYGLGTLGVWWSSSEASADVSWLRQLVNYDGAVIRDLGGKENGFSIRCLRD